MHLKRLTLLHFRNYEEAGIDFSERINCFTGLNGSGKTNLLDAIHYLALCKSFLNPLDSQNIRYDEPFFLIQGVFDSGASTEDNILCSLKRGQRKVFKKITVNTIGFQITLACVLWSLFPQPMVCWYLGAAKKDADLWIPSFHSITKNIWRI